MQDEFWPMVTTSHPLLERSTMSNRNSGVIYVPYQLPVRESIKVVLAHTKISVLPKTAVVSQLPVFDTKSFGQ